MKSPRRVFSIVAALTALLFPLAVLFAADPSLSPLPPKLDNPLRFGTLEDFLIEIVRVVVQYGAILVVFFLVYAGFQFVTAQGNEEKLAQAKKMFVWVVVGAFVLLGVFVLRAAICGTLNQLRAPGTPEFCQSTRNQGENIPLKQGGGAGN
ncbi:MAG: hypothetical protein Greene041679_41 [Parcubacteria group bacterium Greene0416_79]|nr:MAG: hypothetical protein Greene041679_41 [Parcubacteria group bacterium Greene0416_79]